MRVSRVPTLLAQRQKRREKNTTISPPPEEEAISPRSPLSPTTTMPRTMETHLRGKSNSSSSANLADLVLEEIETSTVLGSPVPVVTPTPSPGRRRSLMQSISSSQSRESRDSLTVPSRQGSSFRGRLSRSSASSASGPPASPVPEYLGLNSVYTPPLSDGAEPPLAGDIVFVHGLGGSPFETWSWARDAANFWPPWLPEDDEVLDRFRILTFGYNSNFRGDSTNLEIIDFAKDLLMQMLTFGDGGVGTSRPVFFVAHSMGGLVVKKALLLGMHDRKYAHIVDNVSGIVFLATPHRGAQYARMLNNILSTTAIGPGSKPYVSELERQSTIIQDVNENFRQHCHKLKLVSFYETLKTSFPLAKIILVDKESAVLGYSNEMSASMDADHHSICKFKNQSDTNYLKVKGILRNWAQELQDDDAADEQTETSDAVNSSAGSTTSPPTEADDLEAGLGGWRKTLRAVLGITDYNEFELGALRAGLGAGSGAWLPQRAIFREWLQGEEKNPERPSFFWLSGRPGSGKSVLAASVVTSLTNRGESVQYHFFSTSNARKKTVSYCLRSIAMQLALTNEAFRKALVAYAQESDMAHSAHSQTFHAVWERVFEGIVFRTKFARPLVWIIDGVDEADAPTTLLTALSRVRSASPIRLFFTSRPTKGIALFKDKRVISYLLQPADTAREMRTYTVATVGTIFPDDKTRQKTVVERILRRAEGNFLWVRLILNALQERWHTEEDIRQVLTETPRGMAATYTRMLEAVARQDERIQTLARRILAWTACGVRPLSLEELQAALAGEFPGLINIESTMEQICGNFVSVDWTNPDRPVVALIHSTARQFLLGYSVPDVEPPISSSEGHQQLAATCLAYLGNNDKWRRVLRIMYTKLRRNQHLSDDAAEQLRAEAAEQITSDHPLLEYASKHWAYHVRNSQIQSLYRSLETFFQQHCLSWIEVLAVSDDLSALATAARDLEVYAEQGDGDRPSRTAGIATIDESESAGVKWKTQHLEVSFRRISEGHEISENHGVAMAAGWARDLTRLVAKFGIALRRDPSIIYRRIPILCPQQSMVGQTYGLASHIGSLQSRAASSLSSSALSLDTPERTGSRMCVTGQVSEDWDDCLAMVRVGGDDYLTQILASKDNLIGLVGTTGTVKMWDAHTFEEIQTIEQGECVELMTLNITGTLVATAGFEEICIWELTSGRRVRHMAKPSSASVLTLAFGESDTELVAGLDDASVLWLDMEKQVVSRNFTAEASIGSPHLGCPTKMVLSPEKRWVAMAWRNRPPMVWELSAPPGEPPLRLGGRGLDPEQLIWRPDGAALFVLCPEALYEWRVFDDGHFLDSISLEDYGLDEDEAIEHAHIRSWKMAVSSDGKYLLTSDIAKTVSVWAFPALTLVHREADIDEMINDLIFSLDSRRFYDARGSACTVWIPDVLAHDADRPVSFIPSIASSGCIAPFESGSGASPQSVVTALAPDSTGRHFCAGRADGTVQIHDSVTGLHVRSIYRHSTPVAEVAWSASGALIVSCDESAHVVAKRVQPRVDGEWTVFPVLEAKTEEVGAQLVFNPAETHILISTASADMIWDLESKELTLERKRESDARRGRWVQSLTDSAILLWVDEGVVRKHSWLDLAPVDNVTGTGDDIHDDDTGNHDVSRTNSELSRSLNLTVVWAAHLAVDEGVVFATTSASLPTDITLVSANIHDPQQAVTLEGTVGKLLGMAGSRVVFLDRDSWVCTWDPSLPNLSNEAANGADDGESGVISASVTRHFFVPVDWLATSYPSPSPCLSAAGRALFFPKTDGVAVVWNGFRV